MNEWKNTEIGKLPIDAQLVHLDTCLDLIIDHRGKTPLKLGGDWVNSGIKAISAKNVHGGKLTNIDDIRYVTYEIYKKWMKEDVKKGDCLLASEGATLGEHLYWDFDFPVVLSQRLFCIRTNPEKLDAKYFYSFVTSEYFQNQIHGKASGTSVFGLRQTEVRSMLVSLIPLARQKAIGEIHYTLNKKIDLLHRQNATLEKMAETLFRQWFVEEAKEEWETYTLKDIVKHVKPGTNFQPKRLENGIPFLNVRNLNNGFLDLSDTTKISNEEYQRVHKNWVPEENDLLISRIGTLGIVAVIQKRDLPVAVHYNMINLKAKLTSYQFLYFLLKSQLFQEKYFSNIRQSVQEYVAIEDTEKIEISLPIVSDLFRKYELVFNELYDKVKSNQTQILTLTSLRDTLLPKLMSGEIKIKTK